LLVAKSKLGAHFLLTQTVFDGEQIADFLSAYHDAAGTSLDHPVCWGLQIPVQAVSSSTFPKT